jgi:uncharacterized surface protein with fasciclin (FAS1) repeats
VSTVVFEGSGIKTVSTTWTLGDARLLPSYEGWQTLKVLSPAESESSRASGEFSVNCSAGDEVAASGSGGGKMKTCCREKTNPAPGGQASQRAASAGAAAPSTDADVMRTLRAAGNFKTLVSALEKSGLEVSLRQYKAFTLLAPTDEAFAGLPAARLKQIFNDPRRLRELVLSHVIAARRLTAEDMLGGEGQPAQDFKPEAGAAVRIVCGASPPGGKLPGARRTARIVACDLNASDGVIHAIDAVFLPAER